MDPIEKALKAKDWKLVAQLEGDKRRLQGDLAGLEYLMTNLVPRAQRELQNGLRGLAKVVEVSKKRGLPTDLTSQLSRELDALPRLMDLMKRVPSEARRKIDEIKRQLERLK